MLMRVTQIVLGSCDTNKHRAIENWQPVNASTLCCSIYHIYTSGKSLSIDYQGNFLRLGSIDLSVCCNIILDCNISLLTHLACQYELVRLDPMPLDYAMTRWHGRSSLTLFVSSALCLRSVYTWRDTIDG